MPMRRFLFWLVLNVPLGRLAPWVLSAAFKVHSRKDGSVNE